VPIFGKQPSMAEHPTFESLRRTLEEAAREVLTIEFADVGIEFSKLHPTIRSAIERAAISAGGAKQQVESFLRVTAMADQHDLSDEQKEYALVKAYERHGARLAAEQVGTSGSINPSPQAPALDMPSDSQN
jgi:hypothetical protein